MRTNTPDEGTGGDTAFCRNCGKPMKPEAALCTACGWRRDGETVATRVVREPREESADRGLLEPETPTVRGFGDGERGAGGPGERTGWIVAGVVGLFAVLLLLWSVGGQGGLGGFGGTAVAPARAVRVLPVFDAGGRLLVLHRDEPAAAGAGAAVVVELRLPSGVTAPELVGVGGGAVSGGAGVPGVGLAAAGTGPVMVDLAPLAPGGPANLLPVRPPDRFFERPAPGDATRLEATAAYEAGGFEGRLRLATGGGLPVAASGTLRAMSEGDPTLAAAMIWADDELRVEPDAGVDAGWAAAGAASGTLLFVLPDGAAPAAGVYEVRADGDVLARVELPEPPPLPVVGGGTRPGKILPSPIKRAQGRRPRRTSTRTTRCRTST